MDLKLKIIRHRIKEYFGKVTHRIHFFTTNEGILIDIEYEDFHNEEHVKQTIRKITGENFLLNIKRECTDALLKAIGRHYGHTDNRKEFFQKVAEYEE